MYTITSYGITCPGGLKIFSCILKPEKEGHRFSVVIPFKFSNDSRKIVQQVALILEVHHSEIIWREDLEKPEDVVRK